MAPTTATKHPAQRTMPRMTELTFVSGGNTLAGTLTLPAGDGPWPVVVLLHGAGWGTREYYGAFVDAFLARGVGSFVFDRRGEGESTGSSEQDIFAFAVDAEAAWAAVRTQPGVDSRQVGLWGYSNGAWVAALAASRLPECAFLVLTGASAVSPGEAEAYRRTEELRSQGIPEGTLAAVKRTWSIVFGYLAGQPWQPYWDVEMSGLAAVINMDRRLMDLPVSELAKSNPGLDSVPRFDSAVFRSLRERGGAVPGMGFDPIPALEQVGCPVLVVLAERDQNLPPAESARRFGEVANKRAAGEFAVTMFPGVGHEFSKEASSPGTLGLPMTADEFVPDYLELMAAWVGALPARRG
ncbi:MAG: alpha/beta fold hydrolase [bacterium]